MTSSSYLRFPHVHGDLVTFVAEDDVWIAALSGGRAWRVSSLQLPASNPRFTPDGKKLVWASNRFGKVRGETNIFTADWKN